ncbi:MAG: hypothetical protein LUG98_08595 [Tannerellaceae bacterium]|nr:hypothetical protein [Tannerellaceae bacterium]
MLHKIAQIEQIRREKQALSQQEQAMTQPVLTDLSLLSTLYKWFADYYQERTVIPRAESILQRKKFILIVLRLYSPATLAGGRMPPGLRNRLAEILQLHTPSSISNHYSELLFYYHNYKEFRREVIHVYATLLRQLEHEGYITHTQREEAF